MHTNSLQVAVSKSSDGTVLSELVINSVEWADAGRYTCFAKNALTLDDPVTQNVDLQVFGNNENIIFFFKACSRFPSMKFIYSSHILTTVTFFSSSIFSRSAWYINFQWAGSSGGLFRNVLSVQIESRYRRQMDERRDRPRRRSKKV